MSAEPALLVDARGASALLGICVRTWWSWTNSGKTPAPVPLPGRVRRWSVAELESWIAADCPPRKEWDARKKALASRTTGKVGSRT